MNRCRNFAHVIAVVAFEVTDAKAAGTWCNRCDDFKGDRCDDKGSCQIVEFETQVDHEAFQHWPTVDFGGGD